MYDCTYVLLPSCSKMLHQYAVDKVIDTLESPIKRKGSSYYSDEQSLGAWLSRVRKMHNAIESTLYLPSQHQVMLTLRYFCTFTDTSIWNYFLTDLNGRKSEPCNCLQSIFCWTILT